MKRAAWLAVFFIGCQPVSLDDQPYRCDAARACTEGYRCDCGVCVKCAGAECTACPVDAAATRWWKLDAPASDRAIDCSGHGADGLVTQPASVTAVDGKRGDAWVGDGAALVPNAPVFVGGGESSLSVFIGRFGTDGVFYEERSTSGGITMQLGLSGGDLQYSANGQQWQRFTPGGTGAFLHVAVVSRQASLLELWLDGTMVAPVARTAVTPDTATWRLWRALDEVRSYQRALAADEVAALFNLTCAR